MSFYGDDGDDLESPMFSRKTWVGIVVPLCVVAGIVLIATVFLYRRRRVRRRRNGVSLNQQGRLALERDILEEGYGPGPRRGSQSGPNAQGVYVIHTNSSRRTDRSGRRGLRTANRWAWARNTDLSTITRDAHRMEGLNELGEAPPPYEAPKKSPRPEDRASVAEGVTMPAPAHVRRSSGSGSGTGTLAPERTRSIDGDTIAATVTTARTAATMETAETAADTAMASSSRPESSASLEETTLSPAIGSSLASSSSMPSTAITSPPTSPPAYSERTAATRTGR